MRNRFGEGLNYIPSIFIYFYKRIVKRIDFLWSKIDMKHFTSEFDITKASDTVH